MKKVLLLIMLLVGSFTLQANENVEINVVSYDVEVAEMTADLEFDLKIGMFEVNEASAVGTGCNGGKGFDGWTIHKGLGVDDGIWYITYFDNQGNYVHDAISSYEQAMAMCAIMTFNEEQSETIWD